MAWADAGQRSEAMPVARTGCDFAVSNRPAVSTPATATCRCRYQSLTASGMIYDHVSIKSDNGLYQISCGLTSRGRAAAAQHGPSAGPRRDGV